MTIPGPTPPRSSLSCAGCGASPDLSAPFPFRCPNTGQGDIDHVLRRILDLSVRPFPVPSAAGEREPFVNYRHFLHSYWRARAGGISDEDFVALARRLDDAIASVDGRGFQATPFSRSAELSDTLGFADDAGVFVKDETGNVSGSHKGRHLAGVMLHLFVSEALGLFDPARPPPLAIASCGNAALAAAVVAAAGRWQLRVFVPVDADPIVLERLGSLGAEIVVCRREEGAVGDPTYSKLQADLAMGSLPFTCQGNMNGLSIEGGETLAYEIAAASMEGSAPAPDHLVVQVGGGALASSCAQAFDEMVTLGAMTKPPRLHTVQTTGAHPLERAYRRLRAQLPPAFTNEEVTTAMRDARRARSRFMWPWESEPKSVATGILDDETYDWAAVVSAMLTTGGQPVVASEERLLQAHALATRAGYHADPTGTASLAGLLELLERGVVTTASRVVVLLTGTER
jgi:threonine synthase